jgi:hypothetical protein
MIADDRRCSYSTSRGNSIWWYRFSKSESSTKPWKSFEKSRWASMMLEETKSKFFYCNRTNSFSTMLATYFHERNDDLKRVLRLTLNMSKISFDFSPIVVSSSFSSSSRKLHLSFGVDWCRFDVVWVSSGKLTLSIGVVSVSFHTSFCLSFGVVLCRFDVVWA